MNPKTWIWGVPGYDELVTIVELLATGNVQRGNASGAKRSDFPQRIRRPYDERDVVEKKTVGKAEDARVAAAIFNEPTRGVFSSVFSP